MRALLVVLVLATFVACVSGSGCELNAAITPAAPVFLGGSINSAYMTLTFRSTYQFLSTNFQFLGTAETDITDAPCNALFNGLSNPTYWSAALENPDDDVCTVDFTGVFPSNTSLADCFTRETATDAGTDTYETTVLVTTVQTRVSLRGTAQSTTTTTAISLRFDFQRNITVGLNSTSIVVSGPPDTLSNVYRQIFDPNTLVITIDLYTSVNAPYQLYTGYTDSNFDTLYPFNSYSQAGYTLGTLVDDSSDFGEVVSCSTVGTCSQMFQVTITPPVGACSYSGTLTFYLSEQCNPNSVFTCYDIASPNVTISYQLATTNFCTQVVQDVGFTATLVSYEDDNFETASSSFIYNQRAYFLVTVSTTAGPAASSTDVLTINILSYDKVLTLNNSGDQPPTTGNYANIVTGNPDTAAFTFIISPATIALANNDDAQAVTISVLIRVEYVGLNKQKSHKLQNIRHLLQTGTQTANLNPVIDIEVTPSATSSAATASDGTVSSGLLAMVAGVAAGVLLLAGAAAFFIYRAAVHKSAIARKPPATVTIVLPDSPKSEIELNKN